MLNYVATCHSEPPTNSSRECTTLMRPVQGDPSPVVPTTSSCTTCSWWGGRVPCAVPSTPTELRKSLLSESFYPANSCARVLLAPSCRQKPSPPPTCVRVCVCVYRLLVHANENTCDLIAMLLRSLAMLMRLLGCRCIPRIHVKRCFGKKSAVHLPVHGFVYCLDGEFDRSAKVCSSRGHHDVSQTT